MKIIRKRPMSLGVYSRNRAGLLNGIPIVVGTKHSNLHRSYQHCMVQLRRARYWKGP